MSIGNTLAELARQVRRDTLQLLMHAHPAWLTFAPPGTSNHLLWHAGHALWLQDLLCVQLLTGREELPPGWSETFGADCRPVRDTMQWPRREELQLLLQRQSSRMTQLLEATSDARLQETANPHRGPATAAQRIIHGLHDEAKHGGEMYLLVKLCRASSLPDRQ